jgi:hypothetical protein
MRWSISYEGKRLGLVLFFVSGLFSLPVSVFAVQSVTLGWQPSPTPNVRGYHIYYGTTSHDYGNQITVPGNATSATIWGLVGGQTYYFAANSFTNAQSQSALSPELAYTLPPDAPNQPPILTKLLNNETFVAGQNLSFNISALGNGPLNYQWNFNGQTLPGATNEVLTLINATAAQAGIYFVNVTDNIGTTNSNLATLTLHTASASTQVAANLTAVTGLATMNGNNSQYAFDVSGLAGDTYVVQVSTNFTDWVSVLTNSAPFTFVDTNASQFSHRYYRTVH